MERAVGAVICRAKESKKCTRFSARRSRALSCSIESQGRRESREKEGRPAAAAGDGREAEGLDRPAPDFGARGTRVTTPRGGRAPSPRRTPRRSPRRLVVGARRRHQCGSARRRRRRLLKARRRRASMEEAPSPASEFEPPQSEMEAKLAAL